MDNVELTVDLRHPVRLEFCEEARIGHVQASKRYAFVSRARSIPVAGDVLPLVTGAAIQQHRNKKQIDDPPSALVWVDAIIPPRLKKIIETIYSVNLEVLP